MPKPNLGSAFSEKDLELLKLGGELLLYKEALAVLRGQDQGLLRQACHFLDGHSPVIHSIAQAVRNLLDLWEGQPLLEAEDAPPVEPEGDSTPQPTSKKPYVLKCSECQAVTRSKHRFRVCPKCKAKGVGVSVRFTKGN